MRGDLSIKSSAPIAKHYRSRNAQTAASRRALQIDLDAFYIGRLAGAVTSTAQGIAEAGGGLALATGGGASGGIGLRTHSRVQGCVAGAGVAVEGAIVSAHGAMVALQGVKDTIEITGLYWLEDRGKVFKMS